MIRLSLLLVLLFLSVHSKVEAQDMPGCDCDREDILDSIHSASNIFTGRIVKASMDTKDDEYIRIWVDSIQNIRGSNNGTDGIVTARPEACGVPANIGSQLLFVMVDNSAAVTRCGGSALPHGDNWIYLRLVLTTVELWNSDPAAVRRELSRFGPRQSQEDMRGYFSLLAELDPEADIQHVGDTVRYRGMSFDFSESNYSVRWEN